MQRGLRAPRATEDPYHPGAERIPASLPAALEALAADAWLREHLGEAFLTWYLQIKRQEAQRFEQAEDRDDFARREYFSRL